jgi:hypothetical protein
LFVSVPVWADLKPSVQESDQESKSKAKKPAARDTKKTTPKKLSAGRERGARKFIKLHHPELGSLLSGLKLSNDFQYRAAIHDILRDRDRLTKLAERDVDRHALSLELWKLNSRLRLEVARFSMSRSPESVDKLVELMKNRNNARLRLYSLDRKRLLDRLNKLNTQIKTLNAKTDDGFAKEIDRYRKSVTAKARAKTKADRTRAKAPQK